jgi:hypothetical protein
MPKQTRRNPGDSARSDKASDREPARAARRLARQLEREKASVVERAQRLAKQPEAPARRIACELMALAFDTDPAAAMTALEGLAADADRTVRATAVAFCRVVRARLRSSTKPSPLARQFSSPAPRGLAAVA